MQLRKPLAVAATVSALIIAGTVPAAAQPTDTTFELTGGSLALSVQPTATLTNAATGTTAISGELGIVSVNDERGGTATWTASAASIAFTGDLGSESTAVDYNAGAVTTTGTITVPDGASTALTVEPASVLTPTSLSGNNTAEWTPTLTVTMPADALADAYSGTVTTSIL